MKKYFLVYILFFLVCCDLSAVEPYNQIIRKDSSISFIYTNTKKENLLIVARPERVPPVQPNSKLKYKPGNKFQINDSMSCTGNRNFVCYFGNGKSINVNVTGLIPESAYCFDVYKFNMPKKSFPGISKMTGTKTIKTLAIAPKQNSSNIVFVNSDSVNEITLFWKRGDGKRCFVFCKEESVPDNPENSIELNPNNMFGSTESEINATKTYLVFVGNKKNENKVTVKNLKESTTYYFSVIEANGTGESVNYLLPDKGTKFNPRKKTTPTNPPVAKEATEITDSGFIVNWTPVANAVSYEIDIANDNNFNNYFLHFKSLDVGNFLDMPITDCKPKSEYFFRVRAITSISKTSNSNVIKVLTK